MGTGLLLNLDSFLRADVLTGPAADAFFGINFVPLVGHHVDSLHRAVLGTESTAYALVRDRIANQCSARAGWAAFFKMGLVLATEIFQGGKHRVRGCLA